MNNIKTKLNHKRSINLMCLTRFCMPFGKFLCAISLVLVALNLSGCGRCDSDGESACSGEEVPTHKPNEPTSGNNQHNDGDAGNRDDGETDDNSSVSFQILKRELVTNEVNLGLIYPNDVLHFEVKGTETVPQFSDVYEKVFKSSWETEFCLNTDPHYRDFSGIKNKTRCYKFPLNGNCHHRYRDNQREQVRPIEIPDDTSRLKLKLKIDDKIYPIGKIVKKEANTVKTMLIISSEMFNSVNKPAEAVLIIEKFDAENVKVGFLGFGKCDGVGKAKFNTSGPQDSSFFRVQKVQEFIVSASVEYEDRTTEKE